MMAEEKELNAPGKKKRKNQSYEKKKEAIRKYQNNKQRLYIWVEPEEKEEVRKIAAEKGQSISNFLRARILPQKYADKNGE